MQLESSDRLQSAIRCEL